MPVKGGFVNNKNNTSNRTRREDSIRVFSNLAFFRRLCKTSVHITQSQTIFPRVAFFVTLVQMDPPAVFLFIDGTRADEDAKTGKPPVVSWPDV